MKQVLLSEMVPKEILQELQNAYARYTGMASLISDANGTPVTKPSNFTHFCMDLTRKSELGGKNCQECGRRGALQALQTGKPAVYPCHAGLMDYAAPIILNGNFIGSFTGGQVRTEDVNEEAFRQKAEEYDIDPDEYVDAAKATNLLPREEIERSAQFLSEIASVLSKIAYQRFQLLEEKRLMERASKTRMDLLKKYSTNLNGDLQELTDFLSVIAQNGVDRSDAQAKDFSGKMADNMLRHASELDDTIDYMEIENDDFELRETTYDVRWVINRKVNELLPLAEEKGLGIDCQIDDGVPRLLVGDPTRIAGVIGKCIENSIHYTDERDIRLRLRTEKEGYATTLVIQIVDDGVGIEPKQRRVIEDYINSRGSSDSWNEEFELEGFAAIGYAVNAMSGKLAIESEQGKGTTFTIAIPQLAER